MKKLKKIIIIVISIIVVLIGGLLIYAAKSYKPSSEALAVLNDKNDGVEVTDENGLITFKPDNIKCDKGFIFYPGGKVEPESYSLLCRDIAKEGYIAVIAKMPLNLAIFNEDKADKIIKKYNDIDKWVIGGHSLGGVMASEYAEDNENKIQGLVLLASYPQGDDLEDENINTISIYGSNDQIADDSKIINSKLSRESKIMKIDGGNHAQFGQYGKQVGDGQASISNVDQINITTNLIVELLESI